MAQKYRVLVPVFALVLGVLALALTILAYFKRIKDEEVGPRINGHCAYPSSSACALGIIAAIILLIEQVIISAGTRCFCCCGLRFTSSCAIITSIILFVLSWLAFVIAFMALIYAAILNNSTYLARARPENNGEACRVGKYNVFLGAAMWCIISVCLGLVSYACWACGTANRHVNYHNNYANYEQGVAMGHPRSHQPKDQFQ